MSLANFTVEINEGRDQFGMRCNLCGYQFVQSIRESRCPVLPEGMEYGEFLLSDLVEFALEHDEPGHGGESCERFDPPTDEPLDPYDTLTHSTEILGESVASLRFPGMSTGFYPWVERLIERFESDPLSEPLPAPSGPGYPTLASYYWPIGQRELSDVRNKTVIWKGGSAYYWNNAAEINAEIARQFADPDDPDDHVAQM